MKWAWRVARALITSQYALMLEYRAEIILWALSGVLPLIMLGVWSGSGAATAAGISAQQLSRYFLAAFVVRQFTVVWLINVFEEDALQGRLSPFLLQPISPLWRYLTAHLSEQASRIPIVAVLLVLLGIAAPGLIWLPSAGAIFFGFFAIMAAFLLRFLLQLVLTTFCFWSEKAAAIDRLLMIPYMFLSGIVAPIDTFPPVVKRLAMATPFPWMIDFPARLIAGEPVNIALGFAAITAWCLLLLPICHLLWRAGLRRYSAMGA